MNSTAPLTVQTHCFFFIEQFFVCVLLDKCFNLQWWDSGNEICRYLADCREMQTKRHRLYALNNL